MSINSITRLYFILVLRASQCICYKNSSSLQNFTGDYECFNKSKLFSTEVNGKVLGKSQYKALLSTYILKQKAKLIH